jgi:hypothetical protein
MGGGNRSLLRPSACGIAALLEQRKLPSILGVTFHKQFATGAARYAPARFATLESWQALPLSIERMCFDGDDPIIFKFVQPTGGDVEKFGNLQTY